MMGSENGDPDEKPVHKVTVPTFYLGKYEVTQAQWQAVMGNNPSRFKCANCPVENVSWHDAYSFITKLNEFPSFDEYYLPSEAQWEYACRGGTTGDFAGNLDAMAWYYENSGDARLNDATWSVDSYNRNNNRTHPVGSKQPNAWGLYDMHGNVWEWCEDWLHDSYVGAPSDHKARVTSGGPSRVVRGGSYNLRGEHQRCANHRAETLPDHRAPVVGFRVAVYRRSFK
jgi:formylglycine-generating enzyme required for sulfatase activity